MLLRIIIAITFLFSLTTAHTCTTFFIHHNGQMIFGRNYDWFADAGMVCTNQRGLSKTSMPAKDGKTISWQSKYGSISFNQYGKEFPTGGMNEKGLVVELMWLDGTRYPKPDDRPSIGVLQWIQYQLDNCSSVEEVISTDKILRIVSDGVPLHYLVADANGHTASIEFLAGKMKVHKEENLPIPVLTNDTYESSLAGFKRKVGGNNSLERFITACEMVSAIKAKSDTASLVKQSFGVLEKVAQGDFTKWSIVYDITGKKIYFKTLQNDRVRTINFSDFDFSCNKPSKILDINEAGEGNVNGQFKAYSREINEHIFEKTLKQSSPQVVLTEREIRDKITYPDAIYCK